MDLQSIAPASKTVPLGSGTVEITGLSLRKLTQLVVQFPELLALAAGKIDLAALLVKAPQASLAVFSIAVSEPRRRWWKFWRWFGGAPDQAAVIQSYDEASIGQQIEILFDIFALTFEGERARPFLENLVKTIAAENPAENPKTSADITPESPSA